MLSLEDRVHVKIGDKAGKRYEVPEEVFPLRRIPLFIQREQENTGEVLFDTKGSALVFEEQYLRLKTAVPNDANIYGLGEHTNTFRLDPTNTTRTLWNRDAYGISQELTCTELIQFISSIVRRNPRCLVTQQQWNGRQAPQGSLEYNTIGGILDLYFIGGNEGKSSPADVSRGYAKLAGLPAAVPYWGLVLLPIILQLEFLSNTMWTDIDYMYKRWVFTNDPEYFPTAKMRDIVNYLHKHDQQYIVMVDPAVAYQPDKGYKAFDRGVKDDIFLKELNGSLHKGVVWPGVTVYPDWFHPKVDSYWTNEFKEYFSPQTGIDIDGVWIDMNEPASFCNYPCDNPDEQANATKRSLETRQSTGINYNEPPYKIVTPYLISVTALRTWTSSTPTASWNNLYGTMMSSKTRDAMLARRPGLKPHHHSFDFCRCRCKVRFSIAGMLAMTGIYQVPMVGSDVCGFGGILRRLFAPLGHVGSVPAFYRNHNGDTSISQEFYLWPSVAQAARNAISIRLLPTLGLPLHRHAASTRRRLPSSQQLVVQVSQDANTYAIDLQFFYGDSILVSPVTEENSTSVDIYLPKDIFYDFLTYQPVQGNGAKVSLTNVNFTSIQYTSREGLCCHFVRAARMTTKALREKDFNIVVAPGTDGKATGQLYLDDGVSLDPKASTHLEMNYSNKQLTVKGSTGYKTNSKVGTVTFLALTSPPRQSISIRTRLTPPAGSTTRMQKLKRPPSKMSGVPVKPENGQSSEIKRPGVAPLMQAPSLHNIVENEPVPPTRFDIHEAYTRILNSEDVASTMQQLLESLQRGAAILKSRSSNPLSLTAGCDLFIRYVTSLPQDTSATRSFEDHKEELVKQGRKYAQTTAATCRDTIAQHTLGVIKDDSIVSACNARAAICTQTTTHIGIRNGSSPERTRDEDLRSIDCSGVPCTVVLDSAVAYVMDKVDLVLVGSEAVVESGGLINAVGSYQAALIAKASKVPFYALAESYKFLRLFPLSQHDLPYVGGIDRESLAFGSPTRSKFRPGPTESQKEKENKLVYQAFARPLISNYDPPVQGRSILPLPAHRRTPSREQPLPEHLVPPTPSVSLPATPSMSRNPSMKNFFDASTPTSAKGPHAVATMTKEQLAKNPEVDYTTPDLITLVFTDVGILTPEGVSQFLVGIYAD
ncbi:glycosyl hydrolase 31 family [Rhizoctonia solani]|uniref:Probable alpha/beta-glucosidase agdC n=1 Tax=Rhizoctonia solani TaxID=456999 RepID=A0A8H7IAS2_9AGAM|nr:glycosyl hydrolase 31 family [Rhizoctonia solani]